MPFVINLLLMFLPLMLINSCGTNSLPGEWVYEASERGQSIKLVYTFFKDMTYVQSNVMNGQNGRGDDGTYSREGNVIVLKPRISSSLIRGKLEGGKLILTIQTGGVCEPLQTFEIILSKK